MLRHVHEHKPQNFLAQRNRSDFCDLRLRCPSRTPGIARSPKQEKAMLHCDLRVRWKVASDLRFRAAISEPKTPSFCGISGDLAQSTRKSLAIAIVRFWCAKPQMYPCNRKTYTHFSEFMSPKFKSWTYTYHCHHQHYRPEKKFSVNYFLQFLTGSLVENIPSELI